MRNKRLEEVMRVEQWGEERGLLMEEYHTPNPDVHQQERYLYPDEKNSQMMKLMEEVGETAKALAYNDACLLYTSPSPRDGLLSRMPSSA